MVAMGRKVMAKIMIISMFLWLPMLLRKILIKMDMDLMTCNVVMDLYVDAIPQDQGYVVRFITYYDLFSSCFIYKYRINFIKFQLGLIPSIFALCQILPKVRFYSGLKFSYLNIFHLSR